MNREFHTTNAPEPLGHYSQGVKQAGSTQVSMQFPVDPGHRVRAPVTAGAGRREQEGAIRVLLMLLHQQGHRLLGQRHLADGVLGFRLRHHQFAVDSSDLLAHR